MDDCFSEQTESPAKALFIATIQLNKVNQSHILVSVNTIVIASVVVDEADVFPIVVTKILISLIFFIPIDADSYSVIIYCNDVSFTTQ